MPERGSSSWRWPGKLARSAAGLLVFAAGCSPSAAPSGTGSSGRGFTEDCNIPAHIRGSLPEAIARATEVACRGGVEVGTPIPAAPSSRASGETIPRNTPTGTPEPTPSPTPEVRNLSYFERCVDCGANFWVDRLEIGQKNFRVRVNIENTGELGMLQLIGDKSTLVTFDLAQASRFRENFPKFLQEMKVEELIRQVNPKTFKVQPSADANFPVLVAPTKRWSGWFETTGLLPKDAVAFVLYITPINREKPTNSGDYVSGWLSFDNTQPFVEIPSSK